MKNYKVNYHTHTSRCGHATGTDREYVEAAVSAGLTTLGFSDHSPMIFHSGFYSGFRIPLAEVADYFESLCALREEYKNKIRILVGVEVEYYPALFKDYLAYMAQFPLDYKILGQHFIWDEETGATAFRPSSDPALLQAHYENILAAAATGEFLYIAHPDVMNFTGPEETYLELTADFLCRFKPLGIPLEINRLGMFEGRHYPRQAFWKLVGETDIPAVIGLDAHAPDVFRDEESVQRCFALAEACGVRVLPALDI